MQRAHHADFVFRVRIAGYSSHIAGLFFFGSLTTVRPGLYGHSCRAESSAVILVELNESQLWQTQI